MQLNEKWDDNTIFYSIQDREVDNEGTTNPEVIEVRMYFGHHGRMYTVTVNKDYIENNIPLTCIEGPGEHFGNFEQLLERDYWHKVKEAFARYQKWYEENY